MRPAGFLGAGLARQNFYDGRLALGEALQRRIDFAQFVKMVHALGAAAEFAWRLRTAQQQNAHDRRLTAVEVKSFLEAVFEFGDASIEGVGGAREAVLFEAAQGLADGVIIEIHDRIAIRFLIAGVDEGVQREWIVFGCGDALLDQGTEGSSFDLTENDVHERESYCKVGGLRWANLAGVVIRGQFCIRQ